MATGTKESVLKPSNLYGHYKEAVHVAACSGGSSGLAAWQHMAFANCPQTSLLSWKEDTLA